ncbi:hypothetical protein BU15DRAFT_89482 [Melanogaster broomeanus]|nr:hypothetical protein BU15DRAFT_89482 [Melanogaster broomeanus]
MLMDETSNPRQMPTRKNIIDAMKWLVKDAHPPRFIIFSLYRRTIAIYPLDYKTTGVILDDYHSNGRLRGDQISRRAREEKMSRADVVSFTACRDDQTSADTVQGGMAVGAMSYSYQELLRSVRDILRQNYHQKAQLSSSHPIDTNLRFIL